jgi:transcriptional regulator with XRE-family HTH domain
MSIPHNIRTLRARLNLSQEVFAQKMKVTKGMINKYEQGQALPKIEFLIKLTYLTGATLEQLLYQAIPESEFPKEVDFTNAQEPSVAYRRQVNLYDVRNMVQEIETLRKEIEEIKKANPPKS